MPKKSTILKMRPFILHDDNFITLKFVLLLPKFNNIRYVSVTRFHITLKTIPGDRSNSYVAIALKINSKT